MFFLSLFLNHDFAQIFGCTAFVHAHEPHKSKLEPCAHTCIFLGYAPSQRGYKCYDPVSHKFYVPMDVTFFENHPYFTQSSLQGKNENEDQTTPPFPVLPILVMLETPKNNPQMPSFVQPPILPISVLPETLEKNPQMPNFVQPLVLPISIQLQTPSLPIVPVGVSCP